MISIQDVDEVISDIGTFNYDKVYCQDIDWFRGKPVVFVPSLGMPDQMLGEKPPPVLMEQRWTICPEGVMVLRNPRGVRHFTNYRDDWVSDVALGVESLSVRISYSFHRKVVRKYRRLSRGPVSKYSTVIGKSLGLVRKEFLLAMCVDVIEGLDYERLEYPVEAQTIIECMKSGCLPIGFKGKSLVVVVPNREEIAKEWQRAKSEALAAGEDLSPYGITE